MDAPSASGEITILAAMTKLGQHRTPNARVRAALSRSGWGAACVLALMVAGQCGCTVYQNARRTLIEEPSQFSWRLDRGRSLKVYRLWADEAWAAESGACPDVADADDYSLGFRDGFVDFVYAGGAGEPPPVPPRKFWNVGWRTPAGADAAQQWFTGYRHGAQVARDGGYRMSGIVNSTNAGLAHAAWSESASQSESSPEVIPAPSESPSESAESLDGQMLPTPLSSAGPMTSEQAHAAENLRDDTLNPPPPEDARDDGVGEMPSPDASPATDSTIKGGGMPAGRRAPNLFRRAVSSAQVSSAAGSKR